MNAKHIFKYISYIITRKQDEKQSFRDHNADFLSPGFLDNERQAHQKNDSQGLIKIVGFENIKSPAMKKMTAIDIGSGSGYFSSKFSKAFKKVIGIEPSKNGISVASTLYPKSKYKNITWINGFAEVELAKIDMSKPLFFYTGTVLSHLPDSVVMKICAQLSRAKKKSILLFDEAYGPEYHKYMWHVRTKEWWQKQLPGWEITFNGRKIQNVANRKKGIRAIKIS